MWSPRPPPLAPGPEKDLLIERIASPGVIPHYAPGCRQCKCCLSRTTDLCTAMRSTQGLGVRFLRWANPRAQARRREDRCSHPGYG